MRWTLALLLRTGPLGRRRTGRDEPRPAPHPHPTLEHIAIEWAIEWAIEGDADEDGRVAM